MKFQANGKLMLFGEYLVLKGSKCLAVPLKYNQQAEIKASEAEAQNHKWESFELGESWFSAEFDRNLNAISSTDDEKAEIIQNLLKNISQEKSELFDQALEFSIRSNFPRKYGFGSSSSLVSLLAQWSQTDPYALLQKSFGGSGYDVACAMAKTPILFEQKTSVAEEVRLSREITDNLLFIYSGKKQSSKSEIERFDQLKIHNIAVEEMNHIISSALNSKNITDFENCVEKSESLLEKTIQAKSIRNQLFSNYPFAVKSLGAWGGDFFMASFRSEGSARRYFENQGYPIQFTYEELKYR